MHECTQKKGIIIGEKKTSKYWRGN